MCRTKVLRDRVLFHSAPFVIVRASCKMLLPVIVRPRRGRWNPYFSAWGLRILTPMYALARNDGCIQAFCNMPGLSAVSTLFELDHHITITARRRRRDPVRFLSVRGYDGKHPEKQILTEAVGIVGKMLRKEFLIFFQKTVKAL